MERMIRIAWRTFWVGLGASAVLITQTLLPAKPSAPPARVDAPLLHDVTPVPSPAVARIAQHIPRT
jgi:hypothetical protein